MHKRLIAFVSAGELLGSGTGRLDHLAPFLDFGCQERLSVLRRGCVWNRPQHVDLLLKLGIIHRSADFDAKPFDNWSWRFGRREERLPGSCLETRNAALRNRRQVGILRVPARARYSKGSQCIPFDMRSERGKVVEHDLNLTAEQSIYRLSGTAERYMRHSDSRHGRKQFHGDVGRGADAGRSVIQASRIGFGIYDRTQILLWNPEAGTVVEELNDGRWHKLIYWRWKIVYTFSGDDIVIGRVWPAALGETDLERPL